MKEFKTELAEAVKAMGQEIIDRAEDIVGDGELMTDLTVTLYFPLTSPPTLEIGREHLSKRYFDMRNKEG